jgi:hypothetical protein
LAGLAFLLDFPFLGATFPRSAPAWAFLVVFASEAVALWAGSGSSVVDVVMFSRCAVITAVTTSITRFRIECKRILKQIAKGD